MNEDQPRQLRLLAQYAEERIDQLLSHDTPPRDLGDMTTWRMDRPEYLLEVIDGVLENPVFKERWPSWRAFKREVLDVAQPAWNRGFEAYQRASTEGIEQSKLQGLMDHDPADLGYRVAYTVENGESRQMWFYEGWLAALDEDSETSGENELLSHL